MFFADVVPVNIIPTDGGLLDLLFHHTWIKLNLFGLFDKSDGFLLTLAGLIVLILVGLAATAVAARLAGDKPGKGLVSTVLITILGAYIFAAYVNLPFRDVQIEGVRLVSALLGSIIFGILFVLIRKQVSGKPAKA